MGPNAELRLSNTAQLELLRGFAERGAGVRTTVLGVSMWPFIRDQDVVTIAPLNGRHPRLGDVVAVAFRDPERLVIHRVVAGLGEGWLIRGDACLAADGVAAGSDLLGRVDGVERGGRPVRLGVGAGLSGGGVIAILSRSGALDFALGLWRRSRRAAAAGAKGLQASRRYRAFARRHAPRVTVTEVCDGVGAARPRRDGLRVTEWVARWRGRPVGSVHLVVQPDDRDPWAGHWLSSLAVRAPHRGLGVGEALARTVVERARRDGAPELSLAVQQEDARAVALYRKLGFEDVVVPALEPLLADELARLGRRRVVMRLSLAEAP